MKRNIIKINQISEERIIAVIFIVMIFSTLIISIFKGQTEIKEEIATILKNKEKGKYERVVELTKKSETIFNDNIYLKNSYVDTYGFIQKILQREYVEDSNDRTRDVIKTKEKMLTFIQKKEDMETRATNIALLNQKLEEEKIPFIYIQAPYKIRKVEDLPNGITDYANENANVLLDKLEENKVNIVDLRKVFSTMDIKEQYFTTDHHWKIQTAFKATNYISEIMNEKYDFAIDNFYMDLNHYQVINQKGKYLGSIGKRIGKYYIGTDDFEYIIPDFKTNLVMHKGEEEKVGTFEETILAKNLLEEDEIRENKYASYFGGDYAEVILKNEENLSDKKILMIQDSYGLPFSAFLSLRVRELRTIDLRHFEGSEIEYIQQYHPDIVCMMYNPSSFYIEKNFKFE